MASAPLGLALLRSHSLRLIGGTLCLLLLALTGGAYAYLTGPVLQVVLSGGVEGQAYLVPFLPGLGAPSMRGALVLVALALLVLALLKGLANLGQAVLLDGAVEIVGQRLRVTLYEHLLRLPLAAHRRHGLGDLMTCLIDDVQRVQEALITVPVALLREGLAALALLGVAIWMSPQLAVAAAAALPLAAAAIGLLSRRVKRAAAGRQQHLAALAERASHSLVAIYDVKSCGAEAREVAFARACSRRVARWALRHISNRALAPLANELMAALALGLTLIYAGNRIAAGSLAAERLVSFFAAVLMMYRPIKELGRAVHQWASGQASVERVQRLFAIPVEPDSAAALPPLRRGFELKDLGFAYDERSPVLEDVSLELQRGELVALAGPSGVGKTTLANIVAGLEAPSRGRLLWDGEEITGHPWAALRTQVALVPQQPLLLPATIAENLRYAAPEASDIALRQALGAVGLEAFVASMPQGLGTPLGPPSGVGLSVGETQRLAIARALLREARLLVLDEPSAALDAESERRLVQTLRELREERALLVIAHSPALLAAADRVLWVERGRLRVEHPQPRLGLQHAQDAPSPV